jgi:hypothetical protein
VGDRRGPYFAASLAARFNDDADPRADLWATAEEPREVIVAGYRFAWAHTIGGSRPSRARRPACKTDPLGASRVEVGLSVPGGGQASMLSA